MTIIERVNRICKAVLKLTDEDINAVEIMAQEQSGFTHPLKQDKQAHYNDLGNHNVKVINALKDLRGVLVSGNLNP